MADHPEITAKLDKQHRCIVIAVVGGSKSTTFRISDPSEDLSAAGSPCPAWAQQAVRAWTATPIALRLFSELGELLNGQTAKKGPDGTTVVDRRRD